MPMPVVVLPTVCDTPHGPRKSRYTLPVVVVQLVAPRPATAFVQTAGADAESVPSVGVVPLTPPLHAFGHCAKALARNNAPNAMVWAI